MLQDAPPPIARSLFAFALLCGGLPVLALLAGQMIAEVVLSVLLVPLIIHLFVAIGRSLDARTGLAP